MSTTSKSKSKYFKEGELITNLATLAQISGEYPGYISAKQLHSKNIDDDEYENDEEENENENEDKGENISDFLSKGDYYVPSYLTLFNNKNNNDDKENNLIENISITITPIEKCNPIDDELYNKLIESAEHDKNTKNTKNIKNTKNSKNTKNKKTKKVLNNKNKKSKIGGGGNKTKRKK